ncbi:MAG: hypothetical protein EPN93_01005 [Spirochaetes bacterium]|nr:MAG: hypothetical protein EPN93_01005 [Spirochaetota bacterium]
MNATIENWIGRLHNGEKVNLAAISEIFHLFPGIDHGSILAPLLLTQENIEITGIDQTLSDGNQDIANISFDLSLTQAVSIMNDRFSLSNIHMELNYVTPENSFGDLNASLIGNMTNPENTISQAVFLAINTNESFSRQWVLYSSMEAGALSEFELLKQIVNAPDLQEGLPGYLPPPDTARITNLGINLSKDLAETKNISFELEYGGWMIAEPVALNFKPPAWELFAGEGQLH